MVRKLTIEKIKYESLQEYDLTLLSTEYVNNKHKMEWKDNKTGTKFWRSWGDIKSGRIAPINPKKKLTIDKIRKISLDKYNLTLLSTTYINSSNDLEWLDNKTGVKFYRSWDRIKKGQVGITGVNNYLKDKTSIESYKGLGYQYNQTKEQYLSANKQGSKRLFIIEHPLLDEPWVTTMANFTKCASSYLNKTGMSYGELSIYSILSYNKLHFEYQHSVIINGRLHKFDFYLPEYKLYVEYDGIQHYQPIESWGGDKSLKERKVKDSEKNNYVSNAGATILRIPYTVDTNVSILEVI